MKLILPAAVALLIPLFAQGEVSFEFDYSGSVEFREGVTGEARRLSLEAAARELGSYFADTATLQLSVESSNDQNSDVLAAAGSEPAEVDESFFGFSGDIAQLKIVGGTDQNGSMPDGSVEVNFAFDWDLDDDVSADSQDFKSTLMHELLHVFGFSSTINQDGTDQFDTQTGDPGVWTTFDKFVVDRSGLALIGADFAISGTRWASLHTGGASPGNGLFFGGPATLAANGGQPVGLYSPAAWEEGSSGSHLDDDNPALAGLLMLSATGEGPGTRTLSAIERGMLTDLGYTMRPIPALALTSKLVAGKVQLTLVGEPGRYLIQESTTLDSWSAGAPITLAGLIPGEMEVDAGGVKRFYRAARVVQAQRLGKASVKRFRR